MELRRRPDDTDDDSAGSEGGAAGGADGGAAGAAPRLALRDGEAALQAYQADLGVVYGNRIRSPAGAV